MDEKDILQTTNDVAENDDNAETQPAKGLICAFLDKYIGGIKEYVSLFTFIATVSVAVCGAIMRFFIYIYYCGYTLYWKLPTEIINVKSDNFIFEFIIYTFVSLFIILINVLYYKRLKGKRTIGQLVLRGFIIVVATVAFIGVSQKNVVGLLLFVLLIVLFLPAYSITIADFFPDFIDKIKKGISKLSIVKKIKNKFAKRKRAENSKKKKANYPKRLNSNQNKKQLDWAGIRANIKIGGIVFIIIVPIIMFTILYLGYQEAYFEKEFRVIETSSTVEEQGTETFAIIYETDENYYISPCVIENEKIVEINVDTKDVIVKEGTQYKHFHYKPEK